MVRGVSLPRKYKQRRRDGETERRRAGEIERSGEERNEQSGPSKQTDAGRVGTRHSRSSTNLTPSLIACSRALICKEEFRSESEREREGARERKREREKERKREERKKNGPMDSGTKRSPVYDPSSEEIVAVQAGGQWQ